MPALHRRLPSRREGAGVRKPPRKATASRKGAVAKASHGALRVARICWRVLAVTIKDDLKGWSVASECSLLAMGRYLSRRRCPGEATGGYLGERQRRRRATSDKREPSRGVAGDAISIIIDPDFAERKATRSASAIETLNAGHATAAAWAGMREEARLGLDGGL